MIMKDEKTHLLIDRPPRRSVPSMAIQGVAFVPDLQKWLAYNEVNGKPIHLGFFSTSEEAMRARDRAHEAIMEFCLKQFNGLGGGLGDLSTRPAASGKNQPPSAVEGRGSLEDGTKSYSPRQNVVQNATDAAKDVKAVEEARNPCVDPSASEWALTSKGEIGQPQCCDAPGN